MSTLVAPSVFLLGVGFVGGSLLESLLSSHQYGKITVLVRSEEKAGVLRSLGVTPLVADLDSHDAIKQAVKEHDVTIHAATADDQPSVKAILEGLGERPDSLPAAVYIHTSGTGVLASDYDGNVPAGAVFSDKRPAEIDALPDSAPHRDVDLLIKAAVEGNKVGRAKVSIILPPLVYGIGTGPFNRLSIQVPGWIRQSIALKQVMIFGAGVGSWDHVHIANLVSGYETILSHLLASTTRPPLYFFCETGFHTWRSLTESIQKALVSKGLVGEELMVIGQPHIMGSNSRSSADLLRELGWVPHESLSVWDSVASELEEILKEA